MVDWNGLLEWTTGLLDWTHGVLNVLIHTVTLLKLLLDPPQDVLLQVEAVRNKPAAVEAALCPFTPRETPANIAS